MEADLDLNGHALLNVANFSTDFNVRGNWATATAYAVGDVVYLDVSDSATHGGGSFYTQVAHTSGTFDTDYSSGYWVQIAARGETGASGGVSPSNNLSDLDNLTTALNNLLTAHGPLETADISDDAITLDKLTGATAGDILYWDNSGDPQFLAKGTNGQVLTLASGLPSWAAGSSLAAATQSELETATSTTVATTPGRQQYHPSAAKAWVSFTGSTGAVLSSYNVSSVSRTSTGQYTVNFTTAMSGTNYCVVAGVKGVNQFNARTISQATASCDLDTRNQAGGYGDPTSVFVVFYGDL
jgi:hypothetical protein